MVNIIKIIKIITNPTNYKKILGTSTVKSAMYLFMMLKITNINIY